MSKSPAKVRLVRCPKCENLLPEVINYSVYQCGGCGAVLRAGNKRMDSGVSSEKSGDESDVPSTISKESANPESMSSGSEIGVKSNGSYSRRPNKDDNNIEKPRSRRSVRAANWRYRETDHQEGSSSYNNAPRHEYAELVQHTNDLDIDNNQAELLRKLDELKYEIVRSRDNSHMHKQTHPSMANLNQVQVFNDPFVSHNHRRNPVTSFERNPYHPSYYSGPYVSNNLTDNRLFHHPPPLPPPPPIAPPVLHSDPGYYHHDYNRQFSNLSMESHSSEPHTRLSNDLRRPPRGILAIGVRRCHPVAGGSPFVACISCFELLQLPKKCRKKMQCAACSAVMLVSVVNKRLVFSVYTETTQGPDKSRSDHKTRGDTKSGGTEFSSEDFDNSSNIDFESVDKVPLRGPSLTPYKSALSHSSEDEIKVNIILNDNPVDVAMNANKPSRPPPGSPLQDHFDYSIKYSRGENGNVSKRSEKERDLGPHGNSMKDAAEASVIEIPSNEYSVNTGTSQESGDTSRETHQQRGNEPFFVGMIKKSFTEFSRSSQHVDQGKINVTVNGHPIPDDLVKEAEKLAGPIQPGDYWYDSKAGFWGMMGCPCRGIVPPFIEEFNYPMPENCADGSTDVFVNGRELHQKDLDLLVSRGLPKDENKSYIIDISGRVYDEVSGLDLEGLGRLAPTMERKKQGFGMKPPSTVV